MLRLSPKKSLLVVALLILLALLAGACQTREKGRKPSSDWSRSIPVGVLLRGDIDMITGSREEQLVHMVWLQQVDDQELIHYVKLDSRAESLVDRDLELPDGSVRYPRIAETAGQNLHLLWSSRSEDVREWDLRYTQLDPAGNLVGDVKLLAAADQDISAYSRAPDAQGGIYVAWESEADGGIHGARISSAGDMVQEPMLLARQGESPFLAADGTAVALIWFDGGSMQYARWPDGNLAETAGEMVAEITLGTGQILDGPVMGIAGEWAYVLWSVYSSSGLEAGTAVAKYVAFPKEAPTKSSQNTIRMSSAEETPYAPFESAYQISQLAPPADIRGSSGLVRQLSPAAAKEDELAIAVVVDQESRLDVITQVGLVLFKDGEYAGYQMAGKTDAFSQEPVLAVDRDGHLYIVWREGGRGSVAYFALTDEEGRSALSRMTGGDIASTAMSGGMEVIAGMLFFPLACVWIFPGLLLIGILHLWRGESELNRPLTIVVIVLSVIIAEIVKLAFLPTISSYVPFSAWLDIPSRWDDTLRLLVPVITLAIGLLVAIFVYRRNKSGLLFAFVLIGVDALLTLAVYGVNFLGVF